MSGQQKLLIFAESDKGLEQIEKIMDKIWIRIFLHNRFMILIRIKIKWCKNGAM